MNPLDNRDVILVVGAGNVSIVCQDIPTRANNANAGHRGEGFVVVRAIRVVSYRRLQVPKDLRAALDSRLFIARRYGQNMVYQINNVSEMPL